MSVVKRAGGREASKSFEILLFPAIELSRCFDVPFVYIAIGCANEDLAGRSSWEGRVPGDAFDRNPAEPRQRPALARLGV